MTKSTDKLIDNLAGKLAPMPARLLEQQIAAASAIGAFVVLLLVIGVVGLRADLSTATAFGHFWAKLGYTVSIAVIALVAAKQLARPENSKAQLAVIAVPVGALVVLAALEWFGASASQRNSLLFGVSWRECPVLIVGLSLPLLGFMLRVFSGFAPQRPGLTGATVGLAAGAATAALYSLHCPEAAMTFLLIWYSLGIAIVSALGALIGSRILRW